MGTTTNHVVFGTTDSLKLGGSTVNKSNCLGVCKEYQWVPRIPDNEEQPVKVLAVKVN